MKLKVGVVGPLKSTHLIQELGHEFDDKLVLHPFVYESVEETIEIIRNNEQHVDIWLFSGQMPYFLAQDSKTQKPTFFLPLDGSSLTNVLLHVGYQEQRRLQKLSLDSLSQKLVDETFAELRLDAEHVHLYPYSNYRPVQELIDFHRLRYESGRVETCITGVRSVYDTLKNLDIPVYRIEPTRLSIRQTLERICHQGETMHFQRAQIAIQVVQIEDFIKTIARNLNSYDVYRLVLKVQEIVVEYTEHIQGSFVPLGDNKFMIFSTRGSLQEYGAGINAFLQRVHAVTDLSVHVGTGYGVTALTAEKNAYLALDHAGTYGSTTCAILIDDRGAVHGPLYQPKTLSFSNRTEDTVLLAKLKQVGVSIGTHNKIVAVQANLGQSSISALALSEWLGMTTRNASRILASLKACQLAKIVGKETGVGQGRPRLIYRVGDDSVSPRTDLNAPSQLHAESPPTG